MNDAKTVEEFLLSLPDWRGARLAHYRHLITNLSPSLQESIKWGVPVYSSKKLVMAISGFKNHIKLNFFEGAALQDPHKLFNNGFDSKKSRSIDLQQHTALNEEHLQELIAQAVANDAK